MKTRGRNSPAAIEMAGFARRLEIVERPSPPQHLSADEASEWWDTVNRMPADWFPRETHPMLAEYCRHVIMAQRVAEMIRQAEAADPFDIDLYDKLSRMSERESRVIASLATKMRLTQQTTYDKSKKKPVTPSTPWEG